MNIGTRHRRWSIIPVALPKWLDIQDLDDLDDLKGYLVSVVIAVLAVLFLREAVAWDGARDLLAFGAALALTFYLQRVGNRESEKDK